MKKSLLIFLLCIGSAVAASAQSVTEMVKQADLLEKQFKEDDAYLKFKEIVKLQPQYLYALIKCSELAGRIGRRQSVKEKQIDYYNAAKIYAQRALKVNPNDSDANVVMALAFARMSLLKSGKEKVEFVREIKNYADRALIYNPKNFKALFVIGRWHYELSNLSTLEKAAVKVFFGGVQKNSLDSAIHYFEKVRILSPDFNINYFELARAYYRNDNKRKAIETLNYLLRQPNTAADDPLIKSEARKLLAAWKA